MALVDPGGPIAYGCSLTLRMAGAESNVAIALRRLGVGVRWVSRLGSDPLGDLIADTLAAEGVDTSLVFRDPDAPTGLFIKLRTVSATTVQYYRAGSAASRLRTGDVPDTALDGIELVHLTGITMALSASAHETVVDVARRARARKTRVVFDPNWRPALWATSDEAASAFNEILPYADWVLCGAEEGRILFGGTTPAETIAKIRARGAGDAVVRIGAGGAQLLGPAGAITVAPAAMVDVVDEIGAGDAFAAGFEFGLLQALPPREAVVEANRIAAAALTGTGDWETLPSLGAHSSRPA
jgi:2-dehydro-3-deoxygluconokinase